MVSFLIDCFRMKTPNKFSIRREPEQERSKATMNAIHEATTKLIAQHGSDVISMTAVAKAAGITKPALYRYFPNKQSLVYSVAQSLFKRNRNDLKRHLADQSLPVLKRLKSGLKEYCDLHRKEPFRIRLHSAIHTDPTISELEIQESKENARIAAAYLKKELPFSDETQLFYRLYLVMELTDGLVRLILSSTPEEEEILLDNFVERLLGDLAHQTT